MDLWMVLALLVDFATLGARSVNISNDMRYLLTGMLRLILPQNLRKFKNASTLPKNPTFLGCATIEHDELTRKGTFLLEPRNQHQKLNTKSQVAESSVGLGTAHGKVILMGSMLLSTLRLLPCQYQCRVRVAPTQPPGRLPVCRYYKGPLA